MLYEAIERKKIPNHKQNTRHKIIHRVRRVIWQMYTIKLTKH